MRKRITAPAIVITVIVIFFNLLYVVHSPGEPPSHKDEHKELSGKSPLILSYGDLPGITWVDDIHPIFVRNKCGHCHTRGREVVAEGFKELALGLIDPNDEGNAYYSYHELVYAEGSPQVQEGETLRDGQCCWPRNYPVEKQRRIWIGHPERSVLVRKLEQDYFDWGKPPRFFEEALKLKWGPPMPMFRAVGHEDHGDHGSEGEGQRQYDIRPFYKRIHLHLSLWLGESRDELRQWPPKIPESDRTLLRYWINSTVQLVKDGTGIEVQVLNAIREPVKNVAVRLIGNFNSPDKKEVEDEVIVSTGNDGKAHLIFPKFSIITSTWYVAAEKGDLKLAYKPLIIERGRINQISLELR
jgi:hypothetical protein